MRLSRGLSGAVLLLMSGAIGASAVASDPTPARVTPTVTGEMILQSWKDRESRTQSAEFRWKTYSADNLPESMLRFDQDKVRYSVDDVNNPRVVVSDGTVSKGHVARGGIYPQNKAGEVGVYRPDAVFATPDLRPIWLVYRPTRLNSDCAALSKAVIKESVEPIEGSNCIIVEESSVVTQKDQQRRTKTRQWWVDPQREFCLKRYSVQLDGALLSQLDLFYEDAGKEGWQLSGWKTSRPDGKGVLTEVSSATVISRAINVAIDPGTFDLDIAPGTVIRDSANKSLYVQNHGGSMRPITPEEFGRRKVTVEELLRTEPGMAGLDVPQPRSQGRRVFLWLGVPLLLVVCGTLGLWYRRRAAAIAQAN